MLVARRFDHKECFYAKNIDAKPKEMPQEATPICPSPNAKESSPKATNFSTEWFAFENEGNFTSSEKYFL